MEIEKRVHHAKMAGFNNAPTLIKVVFILAILGVLFHLIGFSTASWVSLGHFHSGLWKVCQGSACYDTYSSGRYPLILLRVVYIALKLFLLLFVTCCFSCCYFQTNLDHYVVIILDGFQYDL